VRREAMLRLAAAVLMVVATCGELQAAGMPKPLKTRLIVGDPEWRELPIREPLQAEYPKCWQIAVNTLLENRFDIAVMDKEAGYIRTTWNEGVLTLGGNWYYKVQVSLKFVFDTSSTPTPTKVRIQVAGELIRTMRGQTVQYFRGYDKVVLESLFQDVQAKLGSI
jgi:hypothetical protein